MTDQDDHAERIVVPGHPDRQTQFRGLKVGMKSRWRRTIVAVCMVLLVAALLGFLAVYHHQTIHEDAPPNLPHGLRQARARTVVKLAKGLAEWVSPIRSLHSLGRDLTNHVDLAELRSWAKAIKFPEADGMNDLPPTEWSKALNFANRQPSWVLVVHRTNGADYVIAEYAGSFGFEGIHIQLRGPEPQSSQKTTFLKIAEGIYGYSQP